uniref:40S ribosomal protein S10 n=1 Tax=Pseudodiaptomus poplesia TaxID=213370 RepID=A0A0U2UFL8_9MAXI|nr:40S ribosomal protein S10 [Pseudodiaptomus poplesia]
MLMPKANRVAIYEHLFKEGVMVAEKNTKAPKHPELETIPNLHVIKALTSLKSRGYVKEQFAWRHYYWYLTNEGAQYLREYLHLPSEIVPSTLKRQAPKESRPGRAAAPRREPREGEGDRAAYRKAPGDGDKAGDAGPGSAPMEFRGGFGRGKPAQ